MCKAHAPYRHLWPAQLYDIFPHYFMNGTIFEKIVTEHETCVLIFSTTSVWKISHSEKNWARYDKKNMLILKYPLFLSDFKETLIFSTEFWKVLKYQI